MEKPVSIQEAAELVGVFQNTLRKWERRGLIKALRTPGGHRRYLPSELRRVRGEQPEVESGVVRVATYCRVSGGEQKPDLERQGGRVLDYCVEKQYQIIASFKEIGSGMSDERSRLRKLFKLIAEHKIDRVVVEHKDRLCRFMFQFLVDLFATHGVTIEWIDEVLGKTYKEELVEDILTLMSSFSAKIYGKRSAEVRKKKKAAVAAS